MDEGLHILPVPQVFESPAPLLEGIPVGQQGIQVENALRYEIDDSNVTGTLIQLSQCYQTLTFLFKQWYNESRL